MEKDSWGGVRRLGGCPWLPAVPPSPCQALQPPADGQWDGTGGFQLGKASGRRWPGAGMGSILILPWCQPGLSRAWVHLQHLAALVPPPALAPATQSIPCPSTELRGPGLVLRVVGVLPWHRLDVRWGPMLLALHPLGTAGLRCRGGLGCREGFSVLGRGLSHWNGQGEGAMGTGEDEEGDTVRVQGMARPAKA